MRYEYIRFSSLRSKKYFLSSFFMVWSLGIDSKEPISLANVAWARICKRFRSPGINSEESIPPAYVTWACICKHLRSSGSDSASLCNLASRYNKYGCRTGPPGWESIPGSLKGLQIRALGSRYNNQFPTRFLVPIDCLKIPAWRWNLRTSSPIPGLHKSFKNTASVCFTSIPLVFFASILPISGISRGRFAWSF